MATDNGHSIAVAMAGIRVHAVRCTALSLRVGEDGEGKKFVGNKQSFAAITRHTLALGTHASNYSLRACQALVLVSFLDKQLELVAFERNCTIGFLFRLCQSSILRCYHLSSRRFFGLYCPIRHLYDRTVYCLAHHGRGPNNGLPGDKSTSS
ncbi:unnamed protein product [Sphagnum balticum]